MPLRESLLVVDDEEMNRNVLSRRLERSGFQVEVATGGSEALAKINARTFDLILLDQMMPGKSGADVLKELRTQHSASDLPVIMVTANTDSSRIAEAFSQGANDYITKPVDFTVALARIRSQLSRKHAEDARRVSEERYELAARAANDGLWDWDLGSNQIYYSERWKSMMGLSDGEIGSSPEEWFSRVHAEDVVALRQVLQRHLSRETEVFEAEYRIRRSDGHYRWMVGRGIVLRDAEGAPLRMAGSQSDITEKKTIDVLTGLPNRLLFAERLHSAWGNSLRDPEAQAAVFFIDVDRFKLANDTLGHLAGDQLLIQFAGRLRCVFGTVPPSASSALVARLAGDEFAVLAEGVSAAAAAALGEKLLRALRPAFQLAGQEYFASASVGIASFRPEHRCSEDLIRDADIAMYAAKSRGRGRCVLFDDSMRDRALTRLQLESDLRMALTRGQFTIQYQPRVDLNNGQIRGFEALLRWKHPERGFIPPDQFIHIAEDTGIIRDIGLWVLGEACEQMKLWRAQFPEMPWLDVAVNVSPVQVRDPDLVRQIAQILAETGLDPSGLQIEITESTLLENIQEAKTILLAIKALGVGLKLDDFATGYSCLRYLYQLPFDTIKIDRSFMIGLDETNPESRELVSTILSMARNLSLGVIAEGVEDRLAVDFLRQQGCKFGQGYFFSPALSPEGIPDILRAGHRSLI